jgi:hypothetical protein
MRGGGREEERGRKRQREIEVLRRGEGREDEREKARQTQRD